MKSIFQSKTFWANMLSLVAVVATATGHPVLGALADPDTQAQVLAVGLPIINIGLRLITKDAVTIK